MHTYAKRSVALDPALVAGIIVGVAAFNALLAITWFILRDRQRVRNRVHKRRISVPVDVEKYEQSLAFAVATGAVPAAHPLKGKEAARKADGKPYRDLALAMQRPHGSKPSSPTRLSRGSSPNSSDSTLLSKFVRRPQDIDVKQLSSVSKLPQGKCPPQPSQQAPSNEAPPRAKRESKRASYLTDTASVYSSASAPPEYHDYLARAQPFALEPPLPSSAPPWISQLPTLPAPVLLSDASRRPTSMGSDERVLSPTPSISDASDAATISPPRERPSDSDSSQPSTSSIFPPWIATNPFAHSRTQSNPSAPPQIRWMTPAIPPAPASRRQSRRPTSVSSLATIYSVGESVASVVVMPLNLDTNAMDAQWGSVELTRSTPLPPARPPRSDKRPAPSASMEHLPLPSLLS